MQINDSLKNITHGITKNTPLEPFEKVTNLSNSFIPDLMRLVKDVEAVGREVHLTEEGSWYTIKQICRPVAFLKNIKQQEENDNTFMHKDRNPIMDTYDVFVNIASFTAYEQNITDKLCFLEVNLRKCKGFL